MEAFWWRADAATASQADETAPGGNGTSDVRLEVQRAESITKLKEVGMPLDSMKLVLNEDLDSLNEDAGHLLNLNERLSARRSGEDRAVVHAVGVSCVCPAF